MTTYTNVHTARDTIRLATGSDVVAAGDVFYLDRRDDGPRVECFVTHVNAHGFTYDIERFEGTDTVPAERTGAMLHTIARLYFAQGRMEIMPF